MHKSAMVRMSWFVENYIKGKGSCPVINVTVSGVPDMSVSKDWDSVHNNVLMVVLKSDSPVKLGDYPVLACERRVKFFDERSNLIKILLKRSFPRTVRLIKTLLGRK